ncbi:MAG: carbohydrate ABC transporter permease [Chloroflexota bacterium]
MNNLSYIKNLKRGDLVKNILLGVTIIFFGFFSLFPFAWMFITSIRPGGELYQVGKNPFGIKAVTLEHYQALLAQTQFLQWMWNSFLIAFVASIIALVIGVIAAYSLGRLRYKGGAFAALIVFTTYLIPPVLLFIPLNDVVNRLNLSNTLWSLILVYLTFLVPFIAWMLSGYFKSIPSELADAARIDGASRIQAMIRIDLPLVLPGVVSIFFFAFTLSWNEYLYAFTFIRSSSKMPVALGVVNALQVGDVFFWGQLMAAAILGSVPVVLVYTFLMDFYLAGLTAGAVKG